LDELRDINSNSYGSERGVPMGKLEPVARVVRWGVESMAFNLSQLPADKLNWKPNPESKSALEVTAEVIGVMRMMLGLLATGSFERPDGAEANVSGPIRYPLPSGLEDAQRQLTETGGAFADALEKAGPELDRAVETPFGTMLGSRVVLWGMIDLVHHHGQISYLQSLLGDGEMHFNPEGRNWFAPDA
jgi:DinB family protein